ncbi:hypothetical protein Avbf_08895 [Armadillidium vulgare]|nr:hypothetical protein Avbf_08895 [Armadillidium vulgare]
MCLLLISNESNSFYYLKIAKVDVCSNCVCLKLRYSIHAYCILSNWKSVLKDNQIYFPPKVVNSVDDRFVRTICKILVNIFQTKILPIYGVSKVCIVSRFLKISLFSEKK